MITLFPAQNPTQNKTQCIHQKRLPRLQLHKRICIYQNIKFVIRYCKRPNSNKAD